MKRNKQTFNNLLRRYNKYLRKIENLRLANRNVRRQTILAKHIERLYEQLMSLKLGIQKGTVVTAVAIGALAFAPQEAAAQNFGPVQMNPFNISAVNSGYSTPTFVDLDGDGDFDMISGEDQNGQFSYYENTGTNTSPTFAAAQINPFGLSNVNDNYSTPTFVDLDGDGDFDMISGQYYYGDFYYFENTGTNVAPAFAAPQVNPFGLTQLQYNSAPTFADLDNDGDFDMISGDYYGNFSYFENTGTNIAPAFTAVQTNPFGLASIGGSYSSPTFADLDNDGDFDMLSGQYYYGDFIYFENTGSNIAPAFAAAQTNPFGLTGLNYNSAPSFVDLDGDGDIDMMSGDQDGDFYYYAACTPSASTISPTAICSYTSPSGNYTWINSNTYMDTIPSASGCDSVITINLTINPIADQTVNAAFPTLCVTGSTSIDLGSSESGVNYYLRDDANDTIVDGPIVGTGAGISLNSGTISTTMTYNVYADLPTNTFGLDFNGNNDKVDCGNSASVQLAGTQITLEAWIYPTGWKGAVWGGTIINKESSGPDQGYMIRCGNNGQVNFNLGDGGWNELNSPTGALVLNTWQHVAATYDGAVMSIYVDGALVASQNIVLSFLSPNSNLSIGNWSLGNGRDFIGKIDEARVWSVNRTQSEIQSTMDSCLTGSESGLAAYYQFEDGTGSSTLTDLTANGNNGTLSGAMDPNSDWASGTTICSSCNSEMTQVATVTIISAVDITTTSNVNMITSNQASATYQWIDCNNGNAYIPSEIAQSYNATASGDYAVEVTIGSCVDTSACVNVVFVGIGELESSTIKTYPNPVDNLFTIELDKISNNTQISIMSIEGKLIYNSSILNDNKLVIDASNWNKGIYIVQISNDEYNKTIKLIKQ